MFSKSCTESSLASPALSRPRLLHLSWQSQLTFQAGSCMHCHNNLSTSKTCTTLIAKIMLSSQVLPDEIKDLYADPASVYNFGWSHGVERLASGQPDKHKGSYYANPLVNVPTTDEALMRQYPAYCRPNIWPTQHVPQYEPAFQ